MSIIYGLAESYAWSSLTGRPGTVRKVLTPCYIDKLSWWKTHWQLTGQPNTKLILSGSAEPIRHPLLTDQLAWYQTHPICIGQTSKRPIVN
jgi:hypothetical protein